MTTAAQNTRHEYSVEPRRAANTLGVLVEDFAVMSRGLTIATTPYRSIADRLARDLNEHDVPHPQFND